MERERINRDSVSRTIQQKNNFGGAYMVDNRSDKNLNYLSDSPLQRVGDEDEETLQGKLDSPLQRVEDEDDTLQGKFDGTLQKKNETGMPDNLKAGIESLSGFSMDDVRVHYNSSKPATVQALAYTQGTDIHVAPWQEKCLPHEAWHVAQQMAGRVSPTTNINGMPVNDNAALEHEADVMGEKAVSQRKETCALKKENNGFVAQRMGFRKILNAFGVNMSSIKEIEKVAEQNENQTRTYEYANILLEDANKRRHDSKMKLGELGENESLSDSEGIPEIFTDAATASSVFDSSSQGESLQRKANITNGTVQRVVQRDLTSNRDVEKEDEIHFYEQIKNIMDSNPNEFRIDNYGVEMNCIGNVRGFVTLHIGASVEYKDDVRAMFYQWVDDVRSKAILVPNGLDIFVSDKFANQCSYNFNSGKICLKPSSINNMFDIGKDSAEKNMMINSVPYACSGDNKVKFGAAVIMHELGHVLHEKSSFDFFNQKRTPLIDNRGNERVDTALKVSYYACKPQQSEAEFVAEVFAGLANGLCFDEDVVSLYWKLNGPRCGELIERDNGKYGYRNASECISVLDNSAQGESLQRKADMTNNAAQRAEAPRPNNTGMPDNLKVGIESLSGFSMDNVRVHYNSSKPATVQAFAYTQGTDIHVAPGQEKYLPHEAWHVAQQMAGRVSPTTNINGMPVNDNAALEHEADVMGEKAVQCKTVGVRSVKNVNAMSELIQCAGHIELVEPVVEVGAKYGKAQTDPLNKGDGSASLYKDALPHIAFETMAGGSRVDELDKLYRDVIGKYKGAASVYMGLNACTDYYHQEGKNVWVLDGVHNKTVPNIGIDPLKYHSITKIPFLWHLVGLGEKETMYTNETGKTALQRGQKPTDLNEKRDKNNFKYPVSVYTNASGYVFPFFEGRALLMTKAQEKGKKDLYRWIDSDVRNDSSIEQINLMGYGAFGEKKDFLLAYLRNACCYTASKRLNEEESRRILQEQNVIVLLNYLETKARKSYDCFISMCEKCEKESGNLVYSGFYDWKQIDPVSKNATLITTVNWRKFPSDQEKKNAVLGIFLSVLNKYEALLRTYFWNNKTAFSKDGYKPEPIVYMNDGAHTKALSNLASEPSESEDPEKEQASESNVAFNSDGLTHRFIDSFSVSKPIKDYFQSGQVDEMINSVVKEIKVKNNTSGVENLFKGGVGGKFYKDTFRVAVRNTRQSAFGKWVNWDDDPGVIKAEEYLQRAYLEFKKKILELLTPSDLTPSPSQSQPPRQPQ